MKLESGYLKPSLRTFLGLFILSIILTLTLRAILHLSTYWNAFDINSSLWWFNLIIYPLGVSLGVTFGARRLRLEITDTDDIEKAKNRTLEYFSNNGFRILENTSNGTTLESTNSFNRLLDNWFGTELVSVRQKDNKIIVEGPFRHVDSIDSKLRFSKTVN
jgi:hypothetical protein